MGGYRMKDGKEELAVDSCRRLWAAFMDGGVRAAESVHSGMPRKVRWKDEVLAAMRDIRGTAINLRGIGGAAR